MFLLNKPTCQLFLIVNKQQSNLMSVILRKVQIRYEVKLRFNGFGEVSFRSHDIRYYELDPSICIVNNPI